MKAQYLLGVIFLIVFCGCNKLRGTDGTYTINGRFLKDCSGDPLANYGIRLYYNGDPYGFSGGNKDVATDTTDANGYYEFRNVPLKYRRDLLVLHDFKADDVENWGGASFGGAKDGDIVQWNFYIKTTYYSVAKFTVDLQHFNTNDTLYIGRNNKDYNIFYPIPSQSTLNFISESSSTGSAKEESRGAIYWGRNWKDFDSARKSQLKYHTFMTKYKLCSYPDTNYFSIP